MLTIRVDGSFILFVFDLFDMFIFGLSNLRLVESSDVFFLRAVINRSLEQRGTERLSVLLILLRQSLTYIVNTRRLGVCLLTWRYGFIMGVQMLIIVV